MNKRLLLTTTAALAIATSAFAQPAPSGSSSNPSATPQQNSTSAPHPSSNTPPTSSAATSSGAAQTTSPSAHSAQTQSPSVGGQSTAAGSTNTGTATNTTQTPSHAQSTQPTNQPGQPSNQAQTNPSATGHTQNANPSTASSNQAQSPSGSNSTNTAQQPSSQQTTADRASNTNVNASVNINDQQRTRISQSISHLNVQPLNSVNFSLSVGTAVPRDVRLQPLPAEVVEVVPQYRGYNFVLVKDEIVVVEPSSYKIVAVLPYSGHSTAAAPVRSEHKTTFSESDREIIRKHVKARSVERGRATTGSTVRTEIRTGERVPEGVEIEAFPDEVYREAPTLREYRYINRDSRTYIVEPQERRVIEEID